MALDHAAIAAMVEPIFGVRWEGKFAPLIDEHPRQISRWRLGESSPSERQQGNVREWALMTAQHLLASVGEDDIAFEVGSVIARRQAVAQQRVAPGWSDTVAKIAARSPEEVERSRLALEALDAKSEARRAARAARAAETV